MRRIFLPVGEREKWNIDCFAPMREKQLPVQALQTNAWFQLFFFKATSKYFLLIATWTLISMLNTQMLYNL